MESKPSRNAEESLYSMYLLKQHVLPAIHSADNLRSFGAATRVLGRVCVAQANLVNGLLTDVAAQFRKENLTMIPAIIQTITIEPLQTADYLSCYKYVPWLPPGDLLILSPALQWKRHIQKMTFLHAIEGLEFLRPIADAMAQTVEFKSDPLEGTMIFSPAGAVSFTARIVIHTFCYYSIRHKRNKLRLSAHCIFECPPSAIDTHAIYSKYLVDD